MRTVLIGVGVAVGHLALTFMSWTMADAIGGSPVGLMIFNFCRVPLLWLVDANADFFTWMIANSIVVGALVGAAARWRASRLQ